MNKDRNQHTNQPDNEPVCETQGGTISHFRHWHNRGLYLHNKIYRLFVHQTNPVIFIQGWSAITNKIRTQKYGKYVRSLQYDKKTIFSYLFLWSRLNVQKRWYILLSWDKGTIVCSLIAVLCTYSDFSSNCSKKGHILNAIQTKRATTCFN